MNKAKNYNVKLPSFISPEERGEGWMLFAPESTGHFEYPLPVGRVCIFFREKDKRRLVIKSYLKRNGEFFHLELRYAEDGTLGWLETPSEIHYRADRRVQRKYWYLGGVYWPSVVRRSGWLMKVQPTREGLAGEFFHEDGHKMTLRSQNNVLPQPSPFSHCEVAFLKENEGGEWVADREGGGPSFLIYERITDPGADDWDSYWKPVCLEWKKMGSDRMAPSPYAIKMGFRQTMTLSYLPSLVKHSPIQVIKTKGNVILGKRFVESPGQLKGVAYTETGETEALYFTPSQDQPLSAIHFLPMGKKQFFYGRGYEGTAQES